MTRYILPLLLLLLVAACSNDSDPAADKSSFTKIYDNNKFSASYYPIDIKQTPDGGFLILGGKRLEDSNHPGTYILKVDEMGSFVSDDETGADIVNPVGLLESNSKYYFFGMKTDNTNTILVEMSADGVMNTPVDVNVGSYPSAAAQDGSNFILLNYNHGDKKSVISIIAPTGGNAIKTKSFDIGAGDDHLDEVITDHFLRTGKQIPFFVGKTASGQYYFNGFYRYTLSLLFTDLSADEPQGEIHGASDDGGLSMALPLGGDKFAVSRFNYGDNYLLPNASLSTNSFSAIDNLDGYSVPELAPNTPVKIISATISAKEYLIYATNTRSRQIALLAYDKATSEFKGTHYLGFSNPFEVASIINTTDGGVAVCGTTHVAGRFPRICLFKLSADQLSDIVN